MPTDLFQGSDEPAEIDLHPPAHQVPLPTDQTRTRAGQPPGLQVLQPAAGVYLQSATPQIQLQYSDNFAIDTATLKVTVKTGNAGTQSANKDLRLGPAYQLPIAVILNDRGGSAPEVLAAGLKENKRATIVGSQSTGCLGSTSSSPLGSDGSQLYVVQAEFSDPRVVSVRGIESRGG